MSTSIRVWSDYVCPWCYVGLKEAEKLHQEFKVELDWQPFELRPGAPETGWAIPEHIRAKMNAPDNPLKLRAQRLGVTLVEREWIPSSRRAHECTEYARSQFKLEPFHAAVLEAYWSRGQDLHEWAVLEAAAVTAGLDPGAMRATVESGSFKSEVDSRVGAAHAIGVHAVPTFLLGEKYLIQGAQEYPVFRQAMERLGAAAK
jgi:predicted DsbA family dithiol-disulfide isomerase